MKVKVGYYPYVLDVPEKTHIRGQRVPVHAGIRPLPDRLGWIMFGPDNPIRYVYGTWYEDDFGNWREWVP